MRAFLLPLLLASAAALPPAAHAQAIVQPLPGTTAADRLAEQMRALGANPNDLNALIAAADLSVGLDDLSAAAALLARADRINPRHPRVKAGMGSILVRSERPGEALRYFAMADGLGIDPQRIASDRGFAYDLIGEQERAQREYRLALKYAAADDAERAETLRRYALSLGISGRDTEAQAMLDPLLRKSDRGAWRARAFVLAMNGKEAEAIRIATTSLPPGMAQGLQPFFDRLPMLPAIDRAFAVHFGEVHTTPERLADRSLAPRLAALGPEPGALTAVQVAQAAPLPTRSSRNSRRQRRETAAPSVQIASVAKPAPAPAPARPATTTTATTTTATPTRYVAQQRAPGSILPRMVAVATPTPTPPPAPTPTPAPTLVRTPALQPSVVASAPAPTAAASAPSATSVTATAEPAVPVAAPPTISPASASPPVVVASAAPLATPEAKALRTSEDSILARIIAGLSIPASELEVAPRPVVRAAPVNAAHVVAEAKAKEARDTAARKLVADQLAADKKVADRKALADKKTLAAKKLADAKKAEDAKLAAAEKKAARANPARLWVQVAGGANESDLPKAYAAVKARAPAVFAGKQAWSTPLRATNRVLAGPFKTEAEARGFVNQLNRSGVSAFTFSSDEGQVVTKLAGR